MSRFADPERIERYELVTLVNDGAMGRLYRAVDLPTGEAIALKILSPAKVGDRIAVGRFLREAHAMRALEHPGIVAVRDVGRCGETYFLAMAWVDGRDLLTEIEERGPFPWDDWFEVASQLAAALHYAHGQGVVHRDVKPANAMRRADGSVVLVDFGLAKHLGSTAEALTQTGSGMGTPHYMSPEQVSDSKHVDHRTDVYSLGATLYQLATGRPPYEGRGAGEVLLAMMTNEVPRLSEHRAGAPIGVTELLVTMLARSPDERPASMRTVLTLVDQLAHRHRGQPAGAGERRGRNRAMFFRADRA